jgi:hypothetical protein
MFNAKNPVNTDAAFRITFYGGWTHTSSGSTANGSNAYGNTHVQSITNLIDFDKSYAMYQSENNTLDGGWEGMYESDINAHFGINLYVPGNNISLGLNTNGGGWGTFFNWIQSYIATLVDTTNRKLYVNGTLTADTGGAPNPFTSALDYYIGASNNNGGGAFLYNNFKLQSVFLKSKATAKPLPAKASVALSSPIYFKVVRNETELLL